MIDKKTQRRVENFAATAGVSPEYFLSKIANEWLDEKGDYVLRRLQQMRSKNVVKQSKPGKKKASGSVTTMRLASAAAAATVVLPVVIDQLKSM